MYQTSLRDYWLKCEDGTYVVGQLPNWPLYLAVIGWFIEQNASYEVLGLVLNIGALSTWAVLELACGVNRWRRLLGLFVFLWQAARVVSLI